MPLTGTAEILTQAVLAAQRAVTDAFVAAHPNGGTPAEVEQLRHDMELARSTVTLAHIVANGQVVGAAAGVTSGSASAPVTGNLI